jgi:hypothetical protein
MSKSTKLALVGAFLALLVLGFVGLRPEARSAPVHAVAVAQSAPSASAAPDTLVDALLPDRPMRVDASRVESADWVSARPGFQHSRSTAERGGVEPCATQAIDTSAFEAWTLLSKGRFIAPRDFGLDQQGRFDLVIHLHGDEPIRRELVKSDARFVLYTLTLDPSQGYAPIFNGAGSFQALVAELEQNISKRSGRAAHVEHVALSAWSAGFVGVEAALAQPVSKDVDAVVLIDGLHAPRNDTAAFKAQLQPFVDYAKRAATGEKFMFISHSSIDPADFASTTECAHYLLSVLGGQPQPVKRQDALGLELIEYFSRGNLHVRGYAGNDKADHCAQLGVLRDVYAALRERWRR